MSVFGVDDVNRVAKNGGVLNVAKGDLVTPLARERARELGVTIGTADPIAPNSRNGRPSDAPSLTGPTQPGAATVNALYRRGAPAPPLPAVGGGTRPRVGAARPRAAVIGAGHVGSVAALRIAESDLFDEVVLIDIAPGLAAGIALDLWHSAGLSRFSTRLSGSDDVAAAAGADYVVITAGRPRKPGMSRTDLTAVNADIVGSVAERLAAVAPQAVLVVVSNPLEEMTHVARLRSGFPPERVLGMAGVLDTARFAALVGLTGKVRPDEVHAYALGSHGPEMVVPLSQATANGRRLTEILDAATLSAIIERTRDSGAEVVKLLQTGSAYFAPGQSAALMVTSMARGDDTVMACAVEPRGEYGLRDTRVGLPVRLGPRGLKEIVVLPLEPAELAALTEAAARLGERIREVG
jgi:malate dehydrogenase